MEQISNTVVWGRRPTLIKLGKIGICLNPFQTLNEAAQGPDYLIPTFKKTSTSYME